MSLLDAISEKKCSFDLVRADIDCISVNDSQDQENVNFAITQNDLLLMPESINEYF